MLLVPIAVSDDLGDKRTGIVLSDEARRSASEGACAALAHGWSNGTLVCPPLEPEKKLSTLTEVERAFALDAPIAPAAWESLRGSFKADYALMFRPENVTSSNRVERSAPSKAGPEEKAARVATSVVLLSPGALIGTLIGTSAAPSSARLLLVNEKERRPVRAAAPTSTTQSPRRFGHAQRPRLES